MAEVLTAVPGSRLLLKSRALSDSEVCQSIRARFETLAVAPERVVCHGFLPDPQDHLNLYNDADVALDTFPYNGTATTCDALWMGLPIVTLEGSAHAARVGASLLRSAGLARLIGRDEGEYSRIAVELASNLPALSELRRSMRGKLLASPLTDVRGFVRTLETAFCEMKKQSDHMVSDS